MPYGKALSFQYLYLRKVFVVDGVVISLTETRPYDKTNTLID